MELVMFVATPGFSQLNMKDTRARLLGAPPGQMALQRMPSSAKRQATFLVAPTYTVVSPDNKSDS